MATFKKIPKQIKAIGSVASGKYCVFAGIMEVGKVLKALEKAEKKGKLPMVGYQTVQGKKYYYCLYGLVNDPDIYANS